MQVFMASACTGCFAHASDSDVKGDTMHNYVRNMILVYTSILYIILYVLYIILCISYIYILYTI